MIKRKRFTAYDEYKIEDGINLILIQNSVDDDEVVSIQEVDVGGVYHITIFYRG